MTGWIKLHKKIREWEWYSDTPVRSVFIHLLLCANYETTVWKGTTIYAGQIPTGRKKIAEELGLSEQQVRRSLNTLANSQQITIQTTNRHSIITITQWELYQKVNEEQPARAPTNNQPETRETTTLKEVKKEEAKNNIYIPANVSEDVWDEFVKMRKDKKAPITERAINAIEKEAGKIGWTLEQAITECCDRGWRGFKSEWVTNSRKENQHGKSKSQIADEAAARGLALALGEAQSEIDDNNHTGQAELRYLSDLRT